MNQKPEPPTTDFESLAADLDRQPPEAALPRNLSDFWLRSITRDLMKAQQMLTHENVDFDHVISGPLYLVVRILEAKRNSKCQRVEELKFSEKLLPPLFEELQWIAEQEIVARATGVYYRTQAITLESVFAKTIGDVTFQ
jgi:hypothetical protein